MPSLSTRHPSERPLTLVVLAAGRGRRFGGLKQLAPVGADGDAIVDVLLRRAAVAGFGRALVVVREEILEEVRNHVEHRGPQIPVSFVVQVPLPGRVGPDGTAPAVLACRDHIDGPFAVANADDLYPTDALATLAEHLSSSDEHALVAFRLERTLLGARPVSRARITTDATDRLTAIHEATVDPATAVGGWISMNLWGWQPSVFPYLAGATEALVDKAEVAEALLPDVAAAMVAAGETIRVLHCESPCLGLTYPEDLDVLRRDLGHWSGEDRDPDNVGP